MTTPPAKPSEKDAEIRSLKAHLALVREERDNIRAELAQARRDAFEEAAKACEPYWGGKSFAECIRRVASLESELASAKQAVKYTEVRADRAWEVVAEKDLECSARLSPERLERVKNALIQVILDSAFPDAPPIGPAILAVLKREL